MSGLSLREKDGIRNRRTTSQSSGGQAMAIHFDDTILLVPRQQGIGQRSWPTGKVLPTLMETGSFYMVTTENDANLDDTKTHLGHIIPQHYAFLDERDSMRPR